MTAYRYDFFISYAKDAYPWVNGELLPKLLRAQQTFLREEDFEDGKPRPRSMQDAITSSRKVLLVLTPEYLTDWEQDFIQAMALTRGGEERDWPLIPVLLKPVERNLLLRSIKAVDLTGDDYTEILANLLENQGIMDDSGAERLPPPYPGILSFREVDEQLFFGREKEVEEYVDCLYRDRLLAIIGPPGSGRSSVVVAGVIPHLQKSLLFGDGTWLVRSFSLSEPACIKDVMERYGDSVFFAPAELVNQYLEERNAQRLLVFIEKFENLLLLDGIPAEGEKPLKPGKQARALLQRLAILARQQNVFIVLSMRDDFYPQLEWCREWLDLYPYLKPIPPLGRKALEDAIRKPAEKLGVWLDDVLVERLLNDAGNEPGILPFVQETMRKLWGYMDERYLRLEYYEHMSNGGVSGLKYAIAARADSVLKSLPSETHYRIARRIFMRLVQFEDGRPNTRRQLPVSRLRLVSDPPQVFDETLALLTQEESPLLAILGEEGQEPKVEIVHEALVNGWPTLQEWLDKYRELEKVLRNLIRKAREWSDVYEYKAGFLDKLQMGSAKKFLSEARKTGYGVDKDVLDYVSASRNFLKRQNINRFLIPFLAVLFVGLLVGSAIYAYRLNLRAEASTAEVQLIPGGVYKVGSKLLDLELGSGDHEIALSAFEMDRYEVTNRLYCLCSRAGVCPEMYDAQYSICAVEYAEHQEEPVTQVTVDHANRFCQWAGKRLPTEYEWEAAARGQAGYIYPTKHGEEPKPKDVNLRLGSDPAAKKSVLDPELSDVSSTGVHGLAGNVAEWTQSWEGQDNLGREFKGDNFFTERKQLPHTVESSVVYRGATAYDSSTEATKAFHRPTADENYSDPFIGFRCAKDVDPPRN